MLRHKLSGVGAAMITPFTADGRVDYKALALLQKYMIPKCYLIDWLCSDDYNNTNRKSRRHIDMLWEAQKWRD